MPNHSDLYKEYNRIRKQILMQARYYKIEKPNFPTAKQLGREVQKSDIQILSTTRKLYIEPIKLARKATRITKQNIVFNEEKPKKKRLTNKQAYKKYSSRFTAINQDGIVIDKITGAELGYASELTAEEIGKYIKSRYESTSYQRPMLSEETEEVFELAAFKQEIQNRINAAAQDMMTGKHGSQRGIDAIQTALNKFDDADWKKAYSQYKSLVDEIRQSLDEALYYAKSEQDHLRAIQVATDLLSLKKDATNFDASDYEAEDLSDFADYQYGRPYKYTKYPVTKIQVR